MVFLLLLLLLPLSQAPTRWPIESLAIEGSEIYSEADILSYAGLRQGLIAGKEELEAARRKLMDTGFFGGAGYRFMPSASGKGIAVILEIQELTETYPLRFQRLSLQEEELKGCLKAADPLYRDWIPASPAILERYARILEGCLDARNQKTSLSGRLWPDRTNNLAVTFGPVTRAPAVAQVQFSGNSAVSAEDLQSAVAGAAIGAAYTEDGFREILDASVRRLYDALGRIRVVFPKITSQPAEGVEGVAVMVEVVEGDVYNLGDVRVETGSGPSPELLKAAAIKTGGIANFDEVSAGVDRVVQQLKRSGYLRPDSRAERIVQEAEKKVDVVIHVEPGPQFQFGKLAVRGLDLDGEAQIRRLWAMRTGQPFDSAYPDYFLSRIREDGVFDRLGQTKAEVQVDEASRTVNVSLSLGGAPKPDAGRGNRRR